MCSSVKRCTHILLTLLCIFPVLFTTCSRRLFISPSKEITSEWPMFHGDGHHSGFLPLATTAPFSLRWIYKTKGAIVSSPIVSSGHLFVSSWDKKIHILNPFTGDRIGRLRFKTGISSTPASSQGRLYVGTEHPRSLLHAFDLATGEVLWRMKHLDIISSPTVVQGMVLFGSADGNIYAVTADSGRVVWTFKTGAQIQSSPAIAHDLIYIGSMDNNVYALEAETGTPVWQYRTGGAVDSSPSVKDDVVFFGSSDSTIYALDAHAGHTLWTFRAKGAIHASPAVDESTCYIGSYDGTLYALTAKTGQLLWQWKTESIIRSSPAVSRDAVFLGAHDGHLYVLDKRDGSLLWTYKTGSSMISSPVLSSVGVFVGCENGFLYAFGFREAASGEHSN